MANNRKLSYSRFCASLGCPLKNRAWSWSSISHDHHRALFSVWADSLVGGRTVMWEKGEASYKQRHGAKEKYANIIAARDGRYEVYGILCYAKDVEAEPRARETFDDQTVLVLRIVDEADEVVGYVIGETTPRAIIAGKGQDAVHNIHYAVADLDSPPAGNDNPDRAQHVSSDFRRDPAVRDHVLRLANGACEYCGEPGFLMPNGNRYLEAHHIIALANSGRDTVDNVIAVCPGHHREAHYGSEAEKLEMEFLERITRRQSK